MTTQQLRETAEAVIAAWKKWVTTHGRRNYSELAVAVSSFGTVDSAHAVVALLAQLEAAKKDAERIRLALETAHYAIETDAEETAIEAGLSASEWDACIRPGFKVAFKAIDAALNPAREVL